MKKVLVAIVLACAPIVFAPVASAEDTVASLFTAVVNATSVKYNTGYIPVSVAPLADNTTIAQSDGHQIVINQAWAQLSLESFDALVAQDISTGYTPGGCNGIAATAIHEVGHVIDAKGGRYARSVVAAASDSIGRNDLHGYAFDAGYLNPGEAVAISFTAVECGTATPAEQVIYKLMF